MCDFRVGGESVRIGITARNLGVWYPHAEIDPIITLAGSGVASEMLIEGRIFTGREAYEEQAATSGFTRTEDFRDACGAFMAKQKPVFRGR